MIETTAQASILEKYNLARLPEEGSEWVGKYFNKLWEDARKEKISRLGMHQRWMDLHAAYRGKRRKRNYPRVGANYLFKVVEAYCATLTEKVPIADITADDADDPRMVKAFSRESESWWFETEQQESLHASVKNMQIYGTTLEKGVFMPDKDEPGIILIDPFNFFPCPGYKMCDLDIPYVCEVDFLEPWEIRSIYGIPDDITIPTDANEQLAGTHRETVRGGKPGSDATGNHYPTNYAPVDDVSTTEQIKNKTLVIEIWVRDNFIKKEPIIQEQQITDDLGRPLDGQVEQIDTGEVNEYPAYPDGIRKVVICPALMSNQQIKGVLEDTRNPNINWELLDVRESILVQNGVQQPAVDEMGEPVIDPMTGTPVMTVVAVTPEQAHQAVYGRAEICYPLWGMFPYSAVGGRVDSTQWWAFATLEQLEELQGKAELMLTKYLTSLEWQMFPILILPDGCNVQKSEIDNGPGVTINPTIASAQYIRYVQPPVTTNDYLEALQFILYEMDVVSMSPEASEGRRPTGISAASAILALQDKAATLTAPMVRQVDKITRNRGRMWMHFKMNFDTTPKQVKVDDEFVQFRGIDIFSLFTFNVESGSSAPITKAGRRQQYVELRKMGDIDRLSMLEYLDIPQAKLIDERLTQEQSVQGALNILVEAGLPIEIAQQVAQIVMQEQFAPKPQGGTTMKTAEDQARQAGGYSEGQTQANQQMSEVRMD
jgi:hypothetical protein